MIEILRADEFDEWIQLLRDEMARSRIQARILRLSLGNPGDVKPVGEGISEMRINHGPGYRVYFWQRGKVVIVLLCGGNKSTQDKDIKTAKLIAARWKE